MKNLSKNNSGNIDTLVFDFDGTLVDTNDIVMGSWQNAARRLYGREFSLDELKATLGEPIMHTVEYLFPDKDPQIVVEAYREFHNENYESMIRIFPGVPEMLCSLKTSGYKIGLVTNRLRHSTEIGLRHFDIEKYFGAIVTVGEAPKDKPAPEHIWFTLDKLGSEPDRAVLVGDSQNVIIGGHNAGLISIRVAWAVATDDGHGDNAAEPDYIIKTPEELPKLIESLNVI